MSTGLVEIEEDEDLLDLMAYKRHNDGKSLELTPQKRKRGRPSMSEGNVVRKTKKTIYMSYVNSEKAEQLKIHQGCSLSEIIERSVAQYYAQVKREVREIEGSGYWDKYLDDAGHVNRLTRPLRVIKR